MSFLDDILDVGSSLLDVGSNVVGWFTGNSLGGSLARTALAGFALNQLTQSINQDNQVNTETAVDPGVRLQVDPDTEHYVPVIYGTAWMGGIVTDAVLSDNKMTMYYCLTLCERTGNTNLGNGPASVFDIGEIYWDDMRLLFGSDGVTVSSAVDREGNVCQRVGGNLKIYCYGGNSETPISPLAYDVGGIPAAYNVMPGWTSSHTMSNTVFAIVRVDYDATKDIKGLGDVRFKVINSMSDPGDCLYDYMTNTRYGAGIPASEINI